MQKAPVLGPRWGRGTLALQALLFFTSARSQEGTRHLASGHVHMAG